MKNLTIQLLKNVFESQLGLLNNAACSRCDASFKNPLLPWIVGSKYFESNEKILFVGKPHRGTPGVEFPSGILDPREPHLDWLMGCSWPYWSYTREILVSLYGNSDPWDYCYFTNIIKCTNVDGEGNPTQDETSYRMVECCINDLGVIFKEIETLEPRHIIFYTYSLYPHALSKLPFAESVAEITGQDHKVKCGQKTLGWWERVAKAKWSDNVKILVTGHPERMKKDSYVSLIGNWIVK